MFDSLYRSKKLTIYKTSANPASNCWGPS